MRQVPLTQMRAGQSGVIVGIMGGFGAIRRLELLGIRVGRKITKVTGMFMWGPVTVLVNDSQVGIGYGMASKVMVEVE